MYKVLRSTYEDEIRFQSKVIYERVQHEGSTYRQPGNF